MIYGSGDGGEWFDHINEEELHNPNYSSGDDDECWYISQEELLVVFSKFKGDHINEEPHHPNSPNRLPANYLRKCDDHERFFMSQEELLCAYSEWKGDYKVKEEPCNPNWANRPPANYEKMQMENNKKYEETVALLRYCKKLKEKMAMAAMPLPGSKHYGKGCYFCRDRKAKHVAKYCPLRKDFPELEYVCMSCGALGRYSKFCKCNE